MEHGGDETQAIAGLLHDSIEDQGNNYTSQFSVEPKKGRPALKRDIELLFGSEVLSIVPHCTDDEHPPGGSVEEKGSTDEWKRRKAAYLKHLAGQTHPGTLRVSCADKLHNARAMLSDYEVLGDNLWPRFKPKTKSDQVWYYRNLAKCFSEHAEALHDAGLKRLSGQLQATVDAIDRHSPVQPERPASDSAPAGMR